MTFSICIPASIERAMLEHVSERLDVPLERLRESRHNRAAIRARWTVMRAMRDRRVSLPRIGDALGVDHTTVLYGLRRFDALAAAETRYRDVARSAALIGLQR